MKGKLNIHVPFPIISISEHDMYVSASLETYAVAKKSSIPELNNFSELIIDAQGVLYRRTSIRALQYINIFRGFSLGGAGFGFCYLDVELEKIIILSIEELKNYGNNAVEFNMEYYEGTTLPIKKYKTTFNALEEREDVLKYLFFFAGADYFHPPDATESDWREKRKL